jgi:hypothetical protein
MEIFNVDALAEVKRRIRLKGVVHDVIELSVQGFINNITAAEANEKARLAADAAGGEVTAAEVLRRTIEDNVSSILESIPSAPREDLLAMPLRSLAKILEFIRGELDGNVVAASSTEGATEKKD